MMVSNSSKQEDGDLNIKSSKVEKKQNWQKKTRVPFLGNQTRKGGNFTKLMQRQNSYISTTTATSNTTQTDLGDIPDSQSDTSIPPEEESGDNVESPAQDRRKSPPITPSTICEEDEEAQLATSSGSVKSDGSKDAGEKSTACESSDFAGDSIGGSSFNDRDESNNPMLEAVVANNKKKPVTASRSRCVIMICTAAFLAAGVAIALTFFVDFTAISGAVVETASPSVSMAPSSRPSLSQVPSDAPSLTPSNSPTVSKMPSSTPSSQPSISAAPTPEPSSLPTVSVEPSDNPSEAPSSSPSSSPSASPSSSPSASPSARPTQHPTITFKPSSRPSRSPTRQPSASPTDSPSRPPITPPPPVNIDDAFKIRLFWNESYFWQESTEESWWCMECVKCKEYGNLDAPDHGCNSYGTGKENRCREGDSIWIRDCRGRGNRFNIQKGRDNAFMLRIAQTDLCIERIKDQHPMLFIQRCDLGSPWQRFVPWNVTDKFEVRPIGYRGLPEVESECISQLHHPKSGEILALHNCALSRQYETLFWEKY